MSSKTLSVSAIENGTVIDHIPAGNALTIIKILKLPKEKRTVTVGLNLPSKALKHKDLIKVENKELSQEEVNQIAILAPTATINIIKNYEVINKFHVELPNKIEKIITCPNPTCITNHERMDTNFLVWQYKNEFQLQCRYCEKFFTKEDLTFEEV